MNIKNLFKKNKAANTNETVKQKTTTGKGDKVQAASAKTVDKVNGQQTAATSVINMMKEMGALDAEHAIGYEQLKDIKLTTPVLAYTLANLMKEKVIIRTEDEHYYYSLAGWKKMERKVYVGYGILIIVPAVAVVLFILLQKFFHF